MTKRTKIILGVIIVVIVAGVIAGYAFARNAGTKVDVSEAQTESLAVTVLGSGKVTAGTKIDVYPETTGLIEKVLVKDGERVSKGDVVLTLQTDALDAQLASAQSALAQAQSALEQANFTAATKQASISAAQASVSAAQDAYDSAKAAEESALKASKAFSQDASLKAAYQQAKLATAQAKAALAQAKAGLTQARKTPTKSAQSAAKKGVAAAQRSVDVAQRALNKTKLKAPIDGVVMYPSSSSSSAALALSGASSSSATAKSNDNTPGKGSALAQGSPAFSVVDDSALSFSAEVDEADIEKVAVGQKVTLTLDAFDGKTFNGEILSIGNIAQTNTTGGTVFVVEMSITDADDVDLKLGMKGDSTIEVENLSSALTVPIEALFSEGGKDYVYVVSNDMLVKTNITAGTTTDTSVEVTSGLKEGQTVALAGASPLSDGMKVRVQSADSLQK